MFTAPAHLDQEISREPGHVAAHLLAIASRGPREEDAEDHHLAFERIVEQCGYEDVSSFRKLFARHVGMTPREYRSRFGVEIRNYRIVTPCATRDT